MGLISPVPWEGVHRRGQTHGIANSMTEIDLRTNEAGAKTRFQVLKSQNHSQTQEVESTCVE